VKRLAGIAALSALLLAAPAVAAPPAKGAKLPIWDRAAPGGALATTQEIEEPFPFDPKSPIVRNVSGPTLTVFPADPARATGAAVVIAPGGGFMFLMVKSEGNDLAEWFATRGVTAFVLRYRLAATPSDKAAFAAQLQAQMATLTRTHAGGPEMSTAPPLAYEDGRQAIRVVRVHAGEWGLDPKRIGIVGFSAGGEVTAEVALHHDPASRPDFAGVIYGGPPEQPAPPPDAPPLFLALAADDALLGTERSERMFDAWRAAHKPVEMHIFAKGNHGFGMNRNGTASDRWIDTFAWWLDAQGVLSRAR
jgi:acetyl esterase/lipase